MIQESNEFFEEPKTANTALHTALSTFRSIITISLQSDCISSKNRAKKKKKIETIFVMSKWLLFPICDCK